tara:strand:+ start:473 stop:1081 length:609 start_codon:yes stop_codon:yes gene_type:complete
MKLFFDLETTGLPQQISYDNWYPPEDIDKYESSRIIEIGIILVDKGEIIETYNAIIKPDTFIKLDPNITKLTGITDDKINEEGKNIKDVLKEIKPLFKKTDCINAYNMNFDKNVLLSELYRIHDREFIKIINNLQSECTFKLSKQILYMGSYKMEHVYKELFKVDPKQDHRAFNDAILCKDVYYKLKQVYKENKKKSNYKNK